MGLLRKKTWWQKIFYSRLTIALLVFLSIAVSLAVYDRYVVEREMAERRIQNEEELNKALSRKKELEDKVEYLKEDRGIESEIRRHFDVALDGERVVVLTGEVVESTTTSPTYNKVDNPEPWWRRILP